MHTRFQASTSLTLAAKQDCSPGRPCPKCSLMMVVRHRFDAFRAKFGREPKPVEPLFFDPSKRLPVKAGLRQAREQIAAAAHAVGVKAGPVLHLLNLDSATQQNAVSIPESRGQTLANRPRPNGRGERRTPSRTASVWERFAGDKRLHRHHNVTPEELKTLSGIAMMGEVRSSRDFLYILDLIRKAGL
jgi:hypothetical protein